MTNSIKLNTEQYEIDSNSRVLAQTDDSFSVSYTETLKQAFATPDTTGAPAYVAIAFGSISIASYVKLSSDQVLSIKLNGGSQVLSNVKNLVLNCDITAISVQNTSGETANIEIDIFGA